MDHPANPECQNVGAPIGVRIVVKKARRIPIQRWVLSVTGHKFMAGLLKSEDPI